MASICPDCDGWRPEQPYKLLAEHDVPGTDGQEKCRPKGVGETLAEAQERRSRAQAHT